MDRSRARAAVAGAAALVLVAGLVAVGTRGDDTMALRVAADGPTSGDAPPLGGPTVTPTPTSTATASAPPTDAPRTPRPTTAAPDDPDPTRPPTPPTPDLPGTPDVTVPPRPTAHPDAPVVTVTGPMATAAPLYLVVRWRHGPATLVRVHTDDGHPPIEFGSCIGPMGNDVTSDGEWSVARVPWSYRRAATYDVVAETWHHDCEDGGSTLRHRGTPDRVTIEQALDATNGPHAPRVTIHVGDREDANFSPDVPPYSFPVSVGSRDPDGWVWSYAIDYGDGTAPEENPGFLADCVSSDFPDTTFPWGGSGGAYTWHTFPGPGTYVITASAVSAGCDGSDRQRSSTRVTFVVPEE